MAHKQTIKGSGRGVAGCDAGLTAEVQNVSPGVARQFLATTRKNRRLSQSRVARLTKAILNDEWVVAQPILFNCDGTLIDGQHRLHAVLESSKTVKMLVIRGFDPDGTFARLDDTQPRKLSHWLQVQGEDHADALAATIAYAMREEMGNPATYASGNPITGPMGIDYLNEHPELRFCMEAPGVINRLMSRGMAAYCYYRMQEKDEALANAFFVDLITGENDAGSQDPLALLRNRLTRDKASKLKMTQKEKLALIIKTWNYLREGLTEVRELRFRTSEGERFPRWQ